MGGETGGGDPGGEGVGTGGLCWAWRSSTSTLWTRVWSWSCDSLEAWLSVSSSGSLDESSSAATRSASLRAARRARRSSRVSGTDTVGGVGM
jgi:hypothetical protein